MTVRSGGSKVGWRPDVKLEGVEICCIHSSMDWAWESSYADNGISAGIEAGRERIVQSRQCEHAPGLAQDENAVVEGNVVPSLLCSTQPGHVHPSPHWQVVGKDWPIENQDSMLVGRSCMDWLSERANCDKVDAVCGTI